MAISTYIPIASYTLASGTPSYTFNSIPNTYKDLVFVMQVKELTNQQGYIRFNSDSNSNYSRTYFGGTGSGNAFTGTIPNQTGCNTAMGDTYGMNIFNIINYSNTSYYKSAIERSSDNNSTSTTAYLWRSTAAINSLTVSSYTGDLSAGSTLSLYGII